jgi:hypothetical protein
MVKVLSLNTSYDREIWEPVVGWPSIFHARAIAISQIEAGAVGCGRFEKPLDIDIHGRPGNFRVAVLSPIEVTSIVQDVLPVVHRHALTVHPKLNQLISSLW